MPNTGSLAGDVLALIHDLANRIEQIGIDVAIGLLGELDDIPEDAKAIVPTAFREVTDHARARGELGDSPIPDAVLSMPGTLIRYNMITERIAPSDQMLDDITNQLFLPLVRYHASR
ncbi:hypothetical protein GCM10022222_57650 [Amycolatopsis ultiminotia]|uniref:Tetracyclin repressor-like C-terminal domain-containing protein n=1 Tax=Amycolatopsis ultiminotia TaxID=543629 RepID=A0ABP6XFW7_9PSEU